MLEQYNDILTIDDLCGILMIGRNRAYEILKTGSLKGFQIGRVWKIPKMAVIEYLNEKANLSHY